MPRFLMIALRPLAVLAALACPHVRAADAPRVSGLRTQTAGGQTYFRVTLRAPRDMDLPELEGKVSSSLEARRRLLARLPRLVPQDGRTSAVYWEFSLPVDSGRPDRLDFVGKVRGDGPARLLLVYPALARSTAKAKEAPPPPPEWGERALTLEFDKAAKVARPERERGRYTEPGEDDLEGRWAAAQARHLAVREAQAPEFGFFALARQLTGRKYRVPAEPLVRPDPLPADAEHRRLYEMTTGAAALTESLATRRLLGRSGQDEARTVDLDTIRGIDVASHPWEQMMGNKRPAPEPLADLVPDDNYYATFPGVRALADVADLLELWGGNLLSAYEFQSSDYGIRQRYEKQLCLPSARLVKKLGPDLVHALALTGSDPYFREGTDVTVIFHVARRRRFLAALEPFLDEARKEFGTRLKERETTYRGVDVESFVTPLREVSLHRAAVGDFVICSNSPVALRRVLDTRAGRRPALSRSPDFRYMRTLFRRSDRAEDGFAFLSDAFIRRLVGPRSKIKEKRRLEALAGLSLVQNAALFTAWETGRLPLDHKALLAASGLAARETELPEGEPATWDGGRKVAVSEVYNTLHFATPLLELPINRVTLQEARDYNSFREDYTRLWRRYFDPVGLRFSQTGRQVRLEAYILPLIESNGYAQLRRLTGGGATEFRPSRVPPGTLAQFLFHSPVGDNHALLKDWSVLRLGDTPHPRKQVELHIRNALNPDPRLKGESEKLFWKLPLTLGIGTRDGKAFSEQIRAGLQWLGFKLERKVSTYKGVEIARITMDPDKYRELAKLIAGPESELGMLFWFLPLEEAPPALYQATVEDDYYLSLRPEPLKELIDRSQQRRKPRGDDRDATEVSASLLVRPSAPRAGDAIGLYLEWETHRRALANEPLWHVLYRSGLVRPDADEAARREAAARHLGFVPVSPDTASYLYDPRTDAVRNARHGSLGRPRLQARLKGGSQLRTLLDQLRTLRADLRFREDGVHTTMTLERKTKEEVRIEHDPAFAPLRRLGGRVETAGDDSAPWARVNLAYSGVNDEALAALKGLTGVRELNLTGTAVTDAGLAHLLPLKNLAELYLAETRVTDAGLARLRGLRGLRVLDLDETAVTDAGLERLKDLPALRTLHADADGVTDAGAAALRKARPGLVIVRAGDEERARGVIRRVGGKVTAGGPGLAVDLNYSPGAARALPHLKCLPGLRVVRLNGSDIRDADLRHVAGVEGLRQLFLSSNPVGDAGMAHLKGLTGLEHLDLSLTRVGDRGLRHLGTLTRLRALDLRDTGVGDTGLAHIKGLSRLEVLRLDGTRVTDAGLKNLAGLKRLERLYLDTPGVTDAGLKHLEGLTRLRELSIDTPGVTDAGADALRKARPGLSLYRLTDEERAGMAIRRTGAEVDWDLSVPGWPVVAVNWQRATNQDLRLLRPLKGLRKLVLAGDEITDAGLAHLQQLTALEHLDLADTGVGDEGLRHLRGLRGLKELNLCGTRVTNRGLAHLRGMTRLELLNVRNTDVTEDGITALRRALPGVRVVR